MELDTLPSPLLVEKKIPMPSFIYAKKYPNSFHSPFSF
jgi:hypothetical protein